MHVARALSVCMVLHYSVFKSTIPFELSKYNKIDSSHRLRNATVKTGFREMKLEHKSLFLMCSKPAVYKNVEAQNFVPV